MVFSFNRIRYDTERHHRLFILFLLLSLAGLAGVLSSFDDGIQLAPFPVLSAIGTIAASAAAVWSARLYRDGDLRWAAMFFASLPSVFILAVTLMQITA